MDRPKRDDGSLCAQAWGKKDEVFRSLEEALGFKGPVELMILLDSKSAHVQEHDACYAALSRWTDVLLILTGEPDNHDAFQEAMKGAAAFDAAMRALGVLPEKKAKRPPARRRETPSRKVRSRAGFR